MTDLASTPRGHGGLLRSNPYVKAIKLYFRIPNRHSGSGRFFFFFFTDEGHLPESVKLYVYRELYKEGEGVSEKTTQEGRDGG